MNVDRKKEICHTCEFSRPALRGLICLLIREDNGRVSAELLAKRQCEGTCPAGKWVELTARNFEDRK